MPTEHLVEMVRTQLLQLVVPELLEQLFQSQAHREFMDPVVVVDIQIFSTRVQRQD